MGKPKESLPFGENTMLGRTAETLLDCTWPVIIVGRGGDQELPPLPLEARVTADERPEAGPLAAMVTGIKCALQSGDLGTGDAVLVVGCDQPWLRAEAVAWLSDQLGDHQAVMPRVADHLQPLCAIYRVDVLPVAEDLLAQGIATPRTLAEKVRCRVLEAGEIAVFDPELRFLRGLNTPEDYQQALAQQ